MESNPPVTLVLAEDLQEAYGLIKLQGLKSDDCAIVQNPDYLEHIKLKPGETIFISANASNEMMAAVHAASARDLQAGQRVTIASVMVSY